MKRCHIVIREEQTIPVEELRDSRNEVWVTINPDLKEPKYDLRQEYILSKGKCYMWNVTFSFNLIPGQGRLDEEGRGRRQGRPCLGLAGQGLG